MHPNVPEDYLQQQTISIKFRSKQKYKEIQGNNKKQQTSGIGYPSVSLGRGAMSFSTVGNIPILKGDMIIYNVVFHNLYIYLYTYQLFPN